MRGKVVKHLRTLAKELGLSKSKYRKLKHDYKITVNHNIPELQKYINVVKDNKQVGKEEV